MELTSCLGLSCIHSYGCAGGGRYLSCLGVRGGATTWTSWWFITGRTKTQKAPARTRTCWRFGVASQPDVLRCDGSGSLSPPYIKPMDFKDHWRPLNLKDLKWKWRCVRVHYVRCLASRSTEPEKPQKRLFFCILLFKKKRNRKKEIQKRADINNEAGTNFCSCVKWT